MGRINMNRLIVGIIVSQTSVGTMVSLTALGLPSLSIYEMVGITVGLESLEVLIGLSLSKIWKEIRRNKYGKDI
jgi:hypothetical protein